MKDRTIKDACAQAFSEGWVPESEHTADYLFRVGVGVLSDEASRDDCRAAAVELDRLAGMQAVSDLAGASVDTHAVHDKISVEDEPGSYELILEHKESGRMYEISCIVHCGTLETAEVTLTDVRRYDNARGEPVGPSLDFNNDMCDFCLDVLQDKAEEDARLSFGSHHCIASDR